MSDRLTYCAKCDNDFTTDSCPCCEINRLKGELEVEKQQHNLRMDMYLSLERQLSEAGAEAGGRGGEVDKVFPNHAAAYEQGKAEGRQQAAREILKLPRCHQCTLNNLINVKFGLEG
jgi:hypothetical protein